MHTAHSALRALGLTPNAEEREVRRAYARALKAIDQELNPEDFQNLRERYELALDYIRRRAPIESEVSEPAGEAISAEVHSDRVLHSPEPLPSAELEAPSEPVQQAPAAQILFERLVADLLEKPADIDYTKLLFDQVLAAPELVALDQRELFEWILIAHLARGWQPRNEALLSVAVRHFGWKEDRRRLLAFGGVGARIDEAVVELIGFNKQPANVRERQMEAIRLTRTTPMPTGADLAKYTEVLGRVVKQFPNLLRIITSAENVDRWLVQGANYVKEKPAQARVQVQADKPSFFSRIPWFFWWFIIMALSKVLSH